jgi:heat shock protein HtpX
MAKETSTFTISSEIPEDYIGDLYEFIYRSALLYKERFTDIKRTAAPNNWSLAYSVNDEKGNAKVRVELTGGKPLTASITPLAEAVSEDEIKQAREDVVVAVNMFEERVRKNSIFFSWRKGEHIVTEHVSNLRDRSSHLFSETQILLMLLFIGLNMLLFEFLGIYFAVVVLAVQFVFMFYSNRIIAKMSDWHITKDDPFLHVLECSLRSESGEDVSKLSRGQLINLKREVYAETISQHGEINRQKILEILSKYGINCKAGPYDS